MQVALAQINARVGDFDANVAKIETRVREAARAGAELVVFPELSVCGYPPRDFLDDPRFLERGNEALERLRVFSAEVPTAFVVGHVERRDATDGKKCWNAATVFAGGKVLARYHKRLLPFYDVFEEERYFQAGDVPVVFTVGNTRFALTICEDLWNDPRFLDRTYAVTPAVGEGNVHAIVNLSASPFHLGKPALRTEVMAHCAKRHHVPLLHANQVGAHDELLFDGGSLALAGDGSVVARGAAFEEDLVLCRLGSTGPIAAWPTSDEEWLWRALAMGVRDYFAKTGARGAVLGLSGGIDSAVVAALAVDALGPANVTLVSLPSRFTASASQEDAATIAAALGTPLLTIPFEPAFEAMLGLLQNALGREPASLTRENLQPRLRMTLLMALSNEHGRLLLNTSNKSELATGYSTLYGDSAGALAPLGDVVKGRVYALARWRNSKGVVVPERVLTRAPSAELRENQTDQDSLPPYDALDALVAEYVEGAKPAPVAPADRQTFRRLYAASEFKRRQFPPVLRVTPKAFGMGRRIPIAARFPS